MTRIYEDILVAKLKGDKLLAVLIDPDKMILEDVEGFIRKVNASVATHIFVGGSEVNPGQTQRMVTQIKKFTVLPVILFPGDVTQISNEADAILFLSLISGRNPDYLIEKHVEAVSKLRPTDLEVIPTAYILIENGKATSVQKVTGTIPMSSRHIQKIVDTAKAGELLGMKLIYLEAGSGASQPISQHIIAAVREDLDIPVLVGGGIRDLISLEKAHEAGADMLVIGTAFEEDNTFFETLKRVYN